MVGVAAALPRVQGTELANPRTAWPRTKARGPLIPFIKSCFYLICRSILLAPLGINVIYFVLFTLNWEANFFLKCLWAEWLWFVFILSPFSFVLRLPVFFRVCALRIGADKSVG